MLDFKGVLNEINVGLKFPAVKLDWTVHEFKVNKNILTRTSTIILVGGRFVGLGNI